MLTTLLDADAFPAAEIAALYAERWQIEIAFLHLKKSLGVPRLHFGGTNRQVSERLFVAQGTVETHVNSLMRKFGVAIRSEAGVACTWHLLLVLTRRG